LKSQAGTTAGNRLPQNNLPPLVPLTGETACPTKTKACGSRGFVGRRPIVAGPHLILDKLTSTTNDRIGGPRSGLRKLRNRPKLGLQAVTNRFSRVPFLGRVLCFQYLPGFDWLKQIFQNRRLNPNRLSGSETHKNTSRGRPEIRDIQLSGIDPESAFSKRPRKL